MQGADSLAIAGGFLENGAKVYITGRRKEVLEQTAEELKKLGGSGSIITYAPFLSINQSG
jgi:NADP-dependent 3-hydroxy acid dehydrogenase YdfG